MKMSGHWSTNGVRVEKGHSIVNCVYNNNDKLKSRIFLSYQLYYLGCQFGIQENLNWKEVVYT